MVLRVGTTGAICLLLAACNRGILDPVGPVGQAEKTIMINSTAIMLAIIIPTMLATIGIAWWFRRGNTKATYMFDAMCSVGTHTSPASGQTAAWIVFTPRPRVFLTSIA